MRQGSLVPPVAVHSETSRPLMKENGSNAGDVETGPKDPSAVSSCQLKDPDDPELLANNTQKRNWRGIALALLVIAFISSIILIAIFLTTRKDVPTDYGPPFTFSDIFLASNLLVTLPHQLSTRGLIHLFDYSLMLLDRRKNTTQPLLSHVVIKQKAGFNGHFSVNENVTAVILRYAGISVHRHSSTGKYDALLFQLGDPESTEKRVELGVLTASGEQPRLSAAFWSPNGGDIAFVQDSHVYIHKNVFSPGERDVVKVTQGLPDENVRYGTPDWLYEEEILASDLAAWWNPVGSRLAFVGFNSTLVKTQKMFTFGNGNELYGRVVDMKYPKAGDHSVDNNPSVQVFIFDLHSGERRVFERPKAVPSDGLFAFARWLSNDDLVIAWTDRVQKKAWIAISNWSRNTSWVPYKTEEPNGWVDMLKHVKQEPVVDSLRQAIYLILPREYSAQRYRGIASLHLNGSSVVATRWLVTPDFDIVDILHHSSATGEFILLATGPDPKNMHVYWATSTGKLSCLTCDDPNCTFSRAEVFPDAQHFVQDCRGPGAPSTYLVYINRTMGSPQNVSVTATRVATVWDYPKLRELVNNRNLPRVQYLNLTLHNGTRDEVTVNAKLLVPRELNASHVKRYPLLLHTYAGPTRQMVTSKFLLDWTVFLASTAKVVVLTVDGRGTGGRGQAFEEAIYKKLGVVEIEDQLEAVKVLLKVVPFINSSQIGAYGWSYGGFTVGHLLGHPHNNLIRCGVSVAPVTDFRYYDTAYAERYLGRIIDDPDAYSQTQIARNARNFRSKSLLLIHGTADDNVHFINSAVLMRALIAANVDVDMMVYPDDDHTIGQRGSREHLYRKTITFLVDCFNRTSARYSMNLSVNQEL